VSGFFPLTGGWPIKKVTDSIHVKSQTLEERKKESRETEEYLQQWAAAQQQAEDGQQMKAHGWAWAFTRPNSLSEMREDLLKYII
jgi:hypothetical protein